MGFKDSLLKIKSKLDYRKTVEVGDSKIEIGLLSIFEEQKLSAEKTDESDEDGSIYLNEIRKKLLSYAIKKVDGDELPNVIEETKDGVTSKKTKEMYLIEVLGSYPASLITYLFDAYVDLRDETDNKFKDVFKFDWYKTPEQREAEEKERLQAEREKQENPEKKEEKIEFREIKEDLEKDEKN